MSKGIAFSSPGVQHKCGIRSQCIMGSLSVMETRLFSPITLSQNYHRFGVLVDISARVLLINSPILKIVNYIAANPE